MIDYILSHKSSLGKPKKTEILSSIFSNHNAMRLKINCRGKKPVKHTHTYTEAKRRKNIMMCDAINNQVITTEIKEEIKKIQRNK